MDAASILLDGYPARWYGKPQPINPRWTIYGTNRLQSWDWTATRQKRRRG
jgi:hypothetical protein